MKKLALPLMVSILMLFSLSAVYGRVYYSDNGRDLTINLNMDFYPVMYSTTWGSSGHYDFVEGAYNKQNWFGLFGIKNESHIIRLTVSTGNGRFVSQSDPSKYRDFYIAMKPIYNKSGDKAFLLDVTDPSFPEVADTSSRVPTTKNASNSLTVYTYPYADGKTIVKVGSNQTSSIDLFYFDILYCADVLQSEDYLHLGDLDDYVATITLQWECTEPGCTEHSGSSIIMVHGFYDSSNPKDSSVDTSSYMVSLSVEPTAESSRLNLKQMLANSEKRKISSLSVSTMYGGSWLNNVRVFISSSPYYNVGGSSFQFVNVNDSTKTIPYTIEVFDSSAGGSWSGTPNKSYDGTNYWVSRNASASMCLNLSNYQNLSYDRKNKALYQVLYSGDVVVSLQDDNNTIYNSINEYAGEYVSNVYYHLVYDN